MNPDILAALVAYLQSVMASSLGVSLPNRPQAWTDFAPNENPDGSDVSLPYAIVMDGPEQYKYSSNDPATGFKLHVIADGSLTIAFWSETKAQARALAIQGVQVLNDSAQHLQIGNGDVTALYPQNTVSMNRYSTGPGVPTIFARVVTVGYQYEFDM